MTPEAILEDLRGWMRERSWAPLAHQEETWRAHLHGESGLVCVPTGMGKTYGAYFGALARAAVTKRTGLKVLWLSPLRAMARDIEQALKRPVADLGLDIEIASRTGDTSSYRRRKLRERLPDVLLTTPESLSVMLSYEDASHMFGGVDAVIVDEWHELCGSKRGTQTELCLARLRGLHPDLQTWALSATVGNLNELAHAATGGASPRIIGSKDAPDVRIRSVLRDPADGRLPWFGYIGATMYDAVVDELDPDCSTLLFTNTRNQAERWFQAIQERRPAWASRLAVHHGSVDRDERQRIEAGLDNGTVTIVVCTSSLDLGVDFSPVERVYQIGSARGVARLLQRAGRSGHQPGAPSEVRMVPTNTMQLVEIEALRRAIAQGQLESRLPLRQPVDVLVQHLVTCALGGGFEADATFDEIRTAWSYRALDRSTFDWCLDLIERGGSSLRNYPQYHKVQIDDGRYVMRDAKLARMHRSTIGTIVGGAQLRIRFLNGKSLGTVEEHFVARLERGDRFIFAGRTLELVSMHGMEARVRVAKGSTDHAPRWLGGRLAVSQSLADATVAVLAEARQRLHDKDVADLPIELQHALDTLTLQAATSALPSEDRVLAEIAESTEGTHLFLYPFAGHLAHEGLSALLAWRLGQRHGATFAISVNDIGIELLAAGGFDFRAEFDDALFATDDLDEDVYEAVNAAELARRQFREVARVSGLVFEGWPSGRKTARQLQTSSGLLHDVFARWEPDNLLLQQARQEVLDHTFEKRRLRSALERLAGGLDLHLTERFSPLAFPLVLDRIDARVSSESMRSRLERMKASWLKEAGGGR